MFNSRKELIDFLKESVISRKLTSSEQKKFATLFPEHRFWIGTAVVVKIGVDDVTEMLRYLVDGEGWDG